ncbi:hydrogenase maturation protease [Planobispora siamensis]|uniref:Peptidase M52 n=1 Tax=Planobispora siamensis TaxID=936338 RepID=A0A8J3SJH0_9ACTN|nr:hydrogenase maturation protease [Planobispora siamensis]GIH93535.1 peptidase M52 [Planobispora siamensis]
MTAAVPPPRDSGGNSAARILVAGVGNVFLGDDGFGVEVAHRLSGLALPAGVRVADYGIRGMHLAYDTVDGDYDVMIMVDAVGLGDPPGTVSVIELEAGAPTGLDAHGMQPEAVLSLMGMLGRLPGRILLVGCEPATLVQRMGLSPTVERAVGTAMEAVVDLIERERTCAWESRER